MKTRPLFLAALLLLLAVTTVQARMGTEELLRQIEAKMAASGHGRLISSKPGITSNGVEWSRYLFEKNEQAARQMERKIEARRRDLRCRPSYSFATNGYDFMSQTCYQAWQRSRASGTGDYDPRNGHGTVNLDGVTYMFVRGNVVSDSFPNGAFTETNDYKNNLWILEGNAGRVVINTSALEFVEAQIPDMAQMSQTLLTNTGQGISFTQNATVKVLNDVYSVVQKQKGGRGKGSWAIQDFIMTVLTDYSYRTKMFQYAEKIYLTDEEAE